MQPDLPKKLLAHGLDKTPNALALVSLTHRWTWRELDGASTRLAVNLLARGLKPGDRVASLMPNRVVLIAHYFACMKAGLVMTPLNYRYTPPEIDHALDLSGASLLLAHGERAEDVAASTLARGLPQGIIWCERADGHEQSIEALMTDPAPTHDLPTLDEAAPALIFFTSGSTGAPKGVTLSRRAILARAKSIGAALGLGPGKTVIPCSSLAHGGAFDTTMATLVSGGRALVVHSADPGHILPLLRSEQPQVLIILPAALFALVRDPSAEPNDFASLAYCGSGGDVVPKELMEEVMKRTGLDIRISYGMTEIGIATCNPPDKPNIEGSVGVPNPGYEMVIRDDDGSEVAPNTDGRLWVRSPADMIGYWDNRQATASTLRDGWVDSGDIMRRDAQGYLWFRGRKKQIIIHDGSNIWPQEVEAALLEHEGVAAAGVVGIRDEVHGEDVQAYVAIKPGAARPTARALIDFARKRIGYKAPEHIVFLDEIPLNSGGKIDRATLKRMAAADSAYDGQTAT